VSSSIPTTDPTPLFRARDGIYAADLFIAAVGWLDFFTWLSDKPSDRETICASLHLARRPADVMLTLFTAMGLIENEDGAFHLTDLARERLVGGSPWDMGPYFSSQRERPTCRAMLEVLRTGKSAGWGSKEDEDVWIEAMEREDFARSFTAAMDSCGAYLAPAMARALDCAGYESLLDVAGGSGIYACAVITAHAHMQGSVLERPPVDKVARHAIAQKGFSDRVSVVSGDMFEGLPVGYDVHLFSHVLHDWDELAVRTLLQRSFDTLPPGGMIAVHDAHLNAEKTGPLPVSEYSVLLMFSTEGKCYSVGEMEALLGEVGFSEMRYVPTVAYRSLVTAKKPSDAS
jgi:predicted O-methyltransferase YrrM